MRSSSHSPSILRPASQYGDYFFPSKQVDSQNGNNYYETQHASLFGDPVPPPPLSYMENFDNHLYGSLQRGHHTKKAASVDNFSTKPPKNYPQPPPSASTISHMGPSAFHITTDKIMRSSSRMSLGGGSKIRRKKNRVMNDNSIYNEYQSSVITNQSEFQSNLDKFRNANNFSPSPRLTRRFIQVEPEETSPPFQRFATRSAVDFRASRRSLEWGEYRPSIDDWGQMIIPRARGRGSAPSNHKHISNISHSHGFGSGSSTSDRNGNSFDDDDYSPPYYRPQRPQLPPPLNVIPYETDTSLPQSPHEMNDLNNLMVAEIPRAASPAIIKETVSTGGDHRVESNRPHKKTSFAIITELTPIHSRASSPELHGRVSPFLGHGFKPPSIFSSRGNSPDNNDNNKVKPLSVHFTFGASDPPALPFKRDAQGVIDYSYRYHDTDDGIERYDIQRDAVHHKTLISITGKPPLAARPIHRGDMKRRSLESLATLRYSNRSFGRRYSYGRLRKASSELQLSKDANSNKLQRSKSNLNPTSHEKGLLHVVSNSGSSPSKIPKLKRKSIGRARLGKIPPRIAVSTGSLAPSPQASPMHELRVPESPSHNSRSLTKKRPKRVTLTTGTVVPRNLTGTRSESTSPNRPETKRTPFNSKKPPTRRNLQKVTLKVPDSDDDTRIPYPRSPQRRGFTTTLSPIIGTPIMGTPMRSFRRTEADRLNEEKEIEKEINRRREERGRQLAIAAKKEAEAAAAAEAALMTGSQYSPSLIPIRNENSRNNTLTTKMNSKVPSRANSRAASRGNSRSNSLDKSRGNSVVNSRESSPTKEYSSTVNSPTKIPYKTDLKRSISKLTNSSSSIMEQTASSVRKTGNSSNRKSSSGDDAGNSIKRNDSTRTSLKNSGSFRRDKTESGNIRKEPPSTKKEPGLKREVSNLKKEPSNIKRDNPKLKKQPSFIRKEGSSTKKEPSVLRREGSSLSKKSSDSSMSRRLDKKNSFMGTNSSSSIGGGTIKRMLSEMTEEERQSVSYESSSEVATENPSPEQAEDEGGGSEKFEKLIPLTRNNVVSMTTAAIASQPIQITTTLTNQIPLGKTNSSNHLVSNENSTTKDHPVATTHDHKSLKNIEAVHKTVHSASDHFKRAIRDNSHSNDSKHENSKKIEKRDSSRTLVISNENKLSEKTSNITSGSGNSANTNQNANPSNNNNNPNMANANIVKNSETTKTAAGVNTERANKDVSSNSSLTNGSSKSISNTQKQPADMTTTTKSSTGVNMVKSNMPPAAVEASVNVISNNNNNPNTANNNKIIGHRGALAPINSGDDSDERVSERAISVPPDVELESGNVAKKPAGTATRIPAGRQQLAPNPKPIIPSKTSVVASDSATPKSAYDTTAKNSTATATSVNTATAASSTHVDESTENRGCCRCCKSPCCGGCCSRSCIPCCSRLFCCCSRKKKTVAKMSDTSTTSRLSIENEKMNKKSSCWGKMRCCGRNMTDLEKAALEEKKKQKMLSKAAMAMQSNKKRGKCRSCMDRFLCCRATNKVGSPAPSNVDEMHHEDGAEHHDDLTPAKAKCCSCCFPCCRCCRKKKPVPMRRESILSNEPPKKSCCGRFWECLKCCKSKPVVEEESRRTSTSKKQSLAPTIPPEDTRPKLDMSLVEHNSLIKGAIPVLHICLAWFCLLCNILVPGSGTIISGFFCLCFGVPRFSQHDGARPRIGSFVINWIIGISQAFCLLFCLVGWGWSVWWGIIMLQTSKKYKKVLEMEALGSHQSNVGGFRPVQPPVVAQNHRDVEAARA